MRITGGFARGLPLKAPKGDTTRPATDALREAVFSSLAAYVPGARVIDLFAGTGAYGLEALSRGASLCRFVERDKSAFECLRLNAASVLKSIRSAGQPEPAAEIQQGEVSTLKAVTVFDWVIADPPYADVTGAPEAMISFLCTFMTPDGLLLLEGPGDLNPPEHPEVKLFRRIGKGKRQPCAWVFKKRLTFEHEKGLSEPTEGNKTHERMP